MAAQIPSTPLNNGYRLPLFGLGTWTATNEDELRVALRVALDHGYRLIDTAKMYGNEHVIGEVLDEYFKAGKLKREEIFITTKLPFHKMDTKAAEETIESQLKDLRVNYIDLYLVHTPLPMKFEGEQKIGVGKLVNIDDLELIEPWRVMEKYHKTGKLRALGVSNFNAKQIQDLYDKAEVKPANLQVECHIYWPQHELHALCKKLGMTLTAYAPIGSPGRIAFRPTDPWPKANPMADPVVKELAEKYKKTPAQILLRHLIQREISVIPKSTNPKRVVENIGLFDFTLSADDQQKLLDIKKRKRLFEFRFASGHRFYPFDDVDLSKPVDENDEGI